MASMAAPPKLMGIVFQPGTLYPTAKKLGPNVLLFNNATGMPAALDKNGFAILEAAGDYSAERLDSEKVKRWKHSLEGQDKKQKFKTLKASLKSSSSFTLRRRKSSLPNTPTSGGISKMDDKDDKEKNSFLNTIRRRRGSVEQSSNGKIDNNMKIFMHQHKSMSTNELEPHDNNHRNSLGSHGDVRPRKLVFQEPTGIPRDNSTDFKHSTTPHISIAEDPTSNGDTHSHLRENSSSSSSTAVDNTRRLSSVSSCAYEGALEMQPINGPLRMESTVGKVRPANLRDYMFTMFPSDGEPMVSIAITENCMALPDEKHKHPHAFTLIHDGGSLTLIADSHEAMLSWVSAINTASVNIYLGQCYDLSKTNTSSDGTEDVRDIFPSWNDYKREYETFLREFNISELNKIKIAEKRDHSKTAEDSEKWLKIRNRKSVLIKNSSTDIFLLDEMLRNANLAKEQQQNNQPQSGSPSSGTPTPQRQQSEGLPTVAPVIVTPSTSFLSPGGGGSNLSSRRSSISQLKLTTLDSSIQLLSVNEASEIQSDIKTSYSGYGLDTVDEFMSPAAATVEVFKELAKIPGTANAVPEPKAKEREKCLMRQLSTEFNGSLVIEYEKNEDGTLDKSHITGATVTKLVEKLADENQTDMDYVNTFFLTYRHFTDVATVIDKIISRINCQPPDGATDTQIEYVRKWRPLIRLRLTAVVKYWLENFWVDFIPQTARRELEDFLILLENMNPEQDVDTEMFNEYAANFAHVAKLMRKLVIYQEQNYKPPAKPTRPEKPKKEFFQLDWMEIAQQLTLAEHQRFVAVRPIELVLQLWANVQEPHVQAELTNIMEMIAHFNQMSYWVATEITTQPELKARALVVEKFIKIAKECRKERNFNTLMAIISGLNLSAVTRLKQTWEIVPEKHKHTIKELEELVSPQGNYKNYRAIYDQMEREKGSVPFIPFFGLFLKDLLFINDGNPKKLENGLINFSKLRTITSKISTIQAWQSVPMNFPVSENTKTYADYVRSLRALKEPALYKYSLLCEAKNGDGNSVRLVDKWAKENRK
ncbi:ras guanine nucleotide exchange factor domain-containing protein [Paraphysoderma sedebokerense]|nr:ras guanine nucleotide exchange factor domain-containing protein [Paraphysoderma sedebokerense]